jgi:hypothetical protein
VSRSARRKKGRPYQPLPARRSNAWVVRLVIVLVGLVLVVTSIALFGSFQ